MMFKYAYYYGIVMQNKTRKYNVTADSQGLFKSSLRTLSKNKGKLLKIRAIILKIAHIRWPTFGTLTLALGTKCNENIFRSQDANTNIKNS